MKKLLIIVGILLLLTGCTNKKEINVEMKDLKDFYSEDYLKVYYDHQNELPIKLDYQESYMLHENIKDEGLIEKVYTALLGIKIGEKTNLDITDAERNYWFTYEDGSTISFMLIKADKDMLIYNPIDKCNYVIEDDNGLFKITIK